jgi:hypothetical protein
MNRLSNLRNNIYLMVKIEILHANIYQSMQSKIVSRILTHACKVTKYNPKYNTVIYND